jgi:hypothetical protein
MTDVIAADVRRFNTRLMTRAVVVMGVLLVLAGSLLAPAFADQQAPQRTASRPVTGFVRNWTRVERWSFFEPLPGGGDPEYTFIANRLQVGVRRTRPRYDATAVLQYVQFGGLPTRAVGPGPLGTGALYFLHSSDTGASQVYLRYLNVRLTDLTPGLALQFGRMAYSSGSEASSGNAKVESVKRQRLDARLIGEFEWSLFQRGYDGARVDFSRGGWHGSAFGAVPTQGGFEDAPGVGMSGVGVFAASITARPGKLLPRTEVQAFAYGYRDRRHVAGRPDNSGLGAARADIGVTTFGITLAGAYAHQGGEADALLWLAGQTGSWYDLDHRAWSGAAEAGHQWTGAPWRPWLRGGILIASGDDDPADRRHGTFFQMLPTVRRYSLSATYSQMNLVDAFGQIMVRPRPALSLRVDLHRVSLAERADRWYAGSGATQESGSIFGYVARLSRDAAGLGTVFEGSADYAISSHWSVNGYLGHIRGGDVIRRNFAGRSLTFAYLENVLTF